jgi:hypothetical protein
MRVHGAVPELALRARRAEEGELGLLVDLWVIYAVGAPASPVKGA